MVSAEHLVSDSALLSVVCLFPPPSFSHYGIRVLIGRHTGDSSTYSVSWVAASNQIHRMKIRPARLSVSREKGDGAAHALTTNTAFAEVFVADNKYVDAL